MGGLRDYLFGFSSEEKAARFLSAQGYEILKRNFHSKFGEIDIIAKKGDILHFVEVKATNGKYDVVYRVDNKKILKIIKTINYYMLKYNLDLGYQIDVVCVSGDKIQIYENVSF